MQISIESGASAGGSPRVLREPRDHLAELGFRAEEDERASLGILEQLRVTKAGAGQAAR